MVCVQWCVCNGVNIEIMCMYVVAFFQREASALVDHVSIRASDSGLVVIGARLDWAGRTLGDMGSSPFWQRVCVMVPVCVDMCCV